MPHIHTGPGQHDHTASAIIIRLDTPEPSVMLHLHKVARKWMQFGGHVELHENPWQAITHEIAEESGYAMGQLRILQPARRPIPSADAVFHPQPVTVQTHRFGDLNHYHTDTAYAFITSEGPAQPAGKGESDTIALFTASQIAAIPADQMPENIRATLRHALEVCLEDWEALDTASFRSLL